MEQAQAAMAEGGGGIPGAEGAAFNPAEGGLPAQMQEPGATREMQTGVTQTTGEEILA